MASRTEQQEIMRVSGWRQELSALHLLIAPRFARPEVGESDF